MEKLWTEGDLAEFLQQSILTLRRNRTAAPHRHPPFLKIGSAVRYAPSEVQQWLNLHVVNAGDVSAPAPVSTPQEKRPKTASAPLPSQKRGPGRPPKAETVVRRRQGEAGR